MTFNASNYIISRSSNRFGGDQDAYLRQAGIAIHQASKEIHRTVEIRGDLIALFHQVVANLAKARQEIAKTAKDINWYYFGLRRDNKVSFDPNSYTLLYDVYEEYRDQYITKLQALMASFPRNTETFMTERKEFNEPPILGKASSTEISLFSEVNQNKWRFPDSYESFQRLCELAQFSIPSRESFSDAWSCYEQLARNKSAMQTLKKASAEEYNRFTLFPNLILKDRAAERSSPYHIKITRRLQVDEMIYELGYALTSTYIDHENDLVKNISVRPVMLLVHMDSFLIQDMMNDMAKVFKEAVECSSRELGSLKQRVALLKYEFAHTMPFYRGSAAIGEWLENALYRFHGYELTYNDKKLSDLEALTSSLGEFVKNYDLIANLSIQYD